MTFNNLLLRQLPPELVGVVFSYLPIRDNKAHDLVLKEFNTFVESGKLVMVDPVMNGFTKDQKPYKVTAKRALQDTKKPNIVELEQLSAVMPFSENSEATITAPGGVMDNDTNIMQFSDGIKIVTDDGMTAVFQSATIQIDDGTMQTSDPVEIEREGFTVRSDRFDVTENGEVLVFQDRVKMNIDPKTVRREP